MELLKILEKMGQKGITLELVELTRLLVHFNNLTTLMNYLLFLEYYEKDALPLITINV